ncbi:nucleotidyltransferase domain-containing protein [Candidatus Woesearchaeota archaeon]|nr:nucleotidyltransferase domain-containing protein [Candidatus Woesearchaeota archaeon]
MAKSLDVSPLAIAKALPLLEKENLLKVKKDKESKRLSIELNLNNLSIIGLKRADNIKQLYESSLISFFRDALPGATVIIFGSYAHGEDTFTSDIDIAVIGIRPKSIDLGVYEKILEKEIIFNYYSSFRNIDKPLLNNILNGITLKGAVEL